MPCKCNKYLRAIAKHNHLSYIDTHYAVGVCVTIGSGNTSSALSFELGVSHPCMPLQNGASFLGNITSILQSQQQEVASLLQGPIPTATPTSQPVLPALPTIGPTPTPVPQTVLPALPTLPTLPTGRRRLKQAQV